MKDILEERKSFPLYNGTSSYYNKNNLKVPRVTEILSSMLHEDFLMKWSNSLGFKRIDYTKYLQGTADIGTVVHDLIDNYIKTGTTRNDINDEVRNAYSAFLNWWSIINKCDYEVIYNEKSIVCDYFGGTLDLLIKINGRLFLVDFKTSKQVFYKHHLQLAAYAYILDKSYNIQIDGACILLLSKSFNGGLYKENILDLSKIGQRYYFDKCKETYLSLTNAFYDRLQSQELFELYRG